MLTSKWCSVMWDLTSFTDRRYEQQGLKVTLPWQSCLIYWLQKDFFFNDEHKAISGDIKVVLANLWSFIWEVIISISGIRDVIYQDKVLWLIHIVPYEWNCVVLVGVNGVSWLNWQIAQNFLIVPRTRKGCHNKEGAIRRWRQSAPWYGSFSTGG